MSNSLYECVNINKDIQIVNNEIQFTWSRLGHIYEEYMQNIYKEFKTKILTTRFFLNDIYILLESENKVQIGRPI